MHLLLKNILVLGVCIFVTFQVTSSTKSAITNEEIAKEIQRFAHVREAFKKEGINVYARFSKAVKSDDDLNVQYDRFELSSISGITNSTDDNDSKLDEDTLQIIFKIAEAYNVTGVVSTDRYRRDGLLAYRQFNAEDVAIEFENGGTKIVYKNIAEGVQEEDEKALDSYVGLMKGFELPVEVYRVVYNESGEVQKSEISKYQPKKVKVIESNMVLNMQLLCAEALKRSVLLKNNTNDRMGLVSKFLYYKYPIYKWKGFAEDAAVSNKSGTVFLKAHLDGETYTISGSASYRN